MMRRVTQRDPDSLESYVRVALALHGYRFTEAQIAEIIPQFSRIEAVAKTIMEYPLPFAAEAASTFRP